MKGKLLNRIKNSTTQERILVALVTTLIVLVLGRWLIDMGRKQSFVITPEVVTASSISTESTSSSSSSTSSSLVSSKEAIVPLKQTKAPEVAKDTTCQRKVYKLAKGSILYRYIELVLKEVSYNCQKTRIVFALAYAESGLCSHQTGYNCWGIFRHGKLKVYSSFENAISNLNEDIGKYLNMTDSQLINNRSYCAGACTDWRRNVANALNTMK